MCCGRGRTLRHVFRSVGWLQFEGSNWDLGGRPDLRLKQSADVLTVVGLHGGECDPKVLLWEQSVQTGHWFTLGKGTSSFLQALSTLALLLL